LAAGDCRTSDGVVSSPIEIAQMQRINAARHMNWVSLLVCRRALDGKYTGIDPLVPNAREISVF
jgi:hypothetical protein